MGDKVRDEMEGGKRDKIMQILFFIKKFAQICLFKTRERKTFRRMYVMIFYNTENPRDKMN